MERRDATRAQGWSSSMGGWTRGQTAHRQCVNRKGDAVSDGIPTPGRKREKKINWPLQSSLPPLPLHCLPMATPARSHFSREPGKCHLQGACLEFRVNNGWPSVLGVGGRPVCHTLRHPGKFLKIHLLSSGYTHLTWKIINPKHLFLWLFCL